jgi:hypothetical protein
MNFLASDAIRDIMKHMIMMKHPALRVCSFGILLIFIGSVMPWLNIPKEVEAGFETESVRSLIGFFRWSLSFMGAAGLGGLFLASKKRLRGYVLISAASIVAIGIMLFFLGSMSATVRRALEIEIGVGYMIGLAGAAVMLFGGIYGFIREKKSITK